MIHSVSKRVIPLLFVLIIAVASFAITASAATTEEEHGGTYGYIIPTDSNLSAQKNSYTFYGNSAKLYYPKSILFLPYHYWMLQWWSHLYWLQR